MFAKPANPGGGGEPPRKPLAASLIAENVTLAGDLSSDGEVHLDGAVRGDVHVQRLCIGETGAVEGAIEADAVDVRGRVRGAISARSVKLYASAQVEGDITHAELAIESGARFNGRSVRAEAAAPLQVVTAAE
jgi:cytoskeletal protein CcmA (bactofilin family)